MTNPSDDVGTFLEGAGLSLTKGTNLFIGRMRDVSDQIPRNVVFIFGSPGGRTERTMGEVTSLRRPHVNVRVRWTTDLGADTKVRAIQEAMQGASISGYLDVEGLFSEPLDMGQDPEGLFMKSLLYALTYEDSA